MMYARLIASKHPFFIDRESRSGEIVKLHLLSSILKSSLNAKRTFTLREMQKINVHT